MGQQYPKPMNYGVFIGDALPGETPILRHPETGDSPLPTTMIEGCDTLWKVFERSAKWYPNNKMLGNRKQIARDQYGEYEYKTYSQVYDEVILFATGVSLLNLCPEITSRSNGTFRFMGIYSKNRREWMVTDIASHMNSVSLVTFYDTLGDNTIEYIVKETNWTTISMETSNLSKIIKLKEEGKEHSLKNIILFDNELPEMIEKGKNAGFNIYTYDEIIRKGREEKVEFTHCKPETLATLSYTSGTTGTPKGTILSHAQLAAEVTTWKNVGFALEETDVYLSYLPLAHAFERVINLFCIYIGATVAFYSGSPTRVVEDAQKCKLTVFIAVPRIMWRIYDKIFENVENSSFLSKSIFNKALKEKLHYLHTTGSVTHSMWDPIVFNKIKAFLGGQCRLLVVGGAPISSDIAETMKVCFCCPLVLGYGQTESCGGALISIAQDHLSDNVGGPIPALEVKVIDVPELNYTTKDINPITNILEPRGELLMRGPTIFKGYFNDDESTRLTLDKDGWLHTGDVVIVKTGHGNAIKLIDRVKSIFKLSQGEYIAPEKIEGILQKCHYVNQLFITGISIQNYIVGVIVPVKEKVVEFLAGKNINVTKENVTSYYTNHDLVSEIQKDLEKVGRQNGWKGFEIVKKVFLFDDGFTIENNWLTPTLKLKRHELMKRFEKEIEDMYKD